MSTRAEFDIEVILASMSAIEYGVVHRFNTRHDFGSVTLDDGGPDVFVHSSEIAGDDLRALKEGQRVSYLAGEMPGRPQATAVHVLCRSTLSSEGSCRNEPQRWQR